MKRSDSFLAVLLCGLVGGCTDDAATTADITGKYVSDCGLLLRLGTTDIYQIGTLAGTRTSYDLTLALFVDASCSVPFVTFNTTGQYVTRPSSIGDDVYEYDATWMSRTIRADSAAALPLLSTGCGTEPWSVGATHDVFASGCAPAGFLPSAQCVHDFDLLRTDGEKLSFGKRPSDNNMCTVDRRPTELLDVTYAKQ